MKKRLSFIFSKFDQFFWGLSGAVIGFILGGICPALAGLAFGVFVGHLIAKDLSSIKIR